MDSLVPPVENPEEKKNLSFLGRHKFTIISLCIIIIALIPLLIISKHVKNNTPAGTIVTQKISATTPTPSPLTQQNAAPTLDAVNSKIQNALDQSNSDLQQAGAVNASQDSTSGL